MERALAFSPCSPVRFINYPEKGVLSPQCRFLVEFLLISRTSKAFTMLHVSFTNS